MKKFKFLLIGLLCLFLTGCSNEFAKQEYDANEKISQMTDRYAKQISVFNPIEGGYSLTVAKFDGRETLWSDILEENQNIEVDFYFNLSKGKAKIVHVDADGNVTTVMECIPETCTDEYVTKVVSLKKGKNGLKIVGYDCEDIDLKMLFAEPQ